MEGGVRTAVLLLIVTVLFHPLGCGRNLVLGVTEKDALLMQKNALRDPGGVLQTWKTTEHFCTFWHLTCDSANAHVVRIDLSTASLAGELVPELGSLTELTTLSMSHNNLVGKIPEELGNLHKLQQLKLNNNELSGPIPKTLEHFGKDSFANNPNLCGNFIGKPC